VPLAVSENRENGDSGLFKCRGASAHARSFARRPR
jgi:hypothetical protein